MVFYLAWVLHWAIDYNVISDPRVLLGYMYLLLPMMDVGWDLTKCITLITSVTMCIALRMEMLYAILRIMFPYKLFTVLYNNPFYTVMWVWT